MELFRLVKLLEWIRRDHFGGDYAPIHISILLYAGLRPGITQTELAQLLNVNQGTVSRACKRLSAEALPRGESGYGLVEMKADEVYDSRRLAVHLTASGKDFFDRVKQFLQ